MPDVTLDKRRALGRGLESLIPAARGAAIPAEPSADAVREIPLDLIDPSPYQTRGPMHEPALRELADSIAAQGVLQPVTVRPMPGGRFQLIAGERRWRASERAGRTTVPAIVRPCSNEQAAELTLIENLQREDLNPMEQARAYERLSREFGLTQEEMARRTGKDRASVSNYLRLLKLPPSVQASVEDGSITFGHAKALMPLEDPALIEQGRLRIVRDDLSVRQAETMVQAMLHPVEKEKEAPPERHVDPNVRAAEREIQAALGVKVTISDRGGKGKITLQYASLEDFDRIVERLGEKR